MGFDWKVWLIAGVIICVSIIGVVVANLQTVERTSVIAEKYAYKDTIITVNPDDSSIGIPIKTMKYMFIMENGDEIQVEKTDYLQYEEGDNFTYLITIWK